MCAMDSPPRAIINGNIILLLPRQPALNWIVSLEPMQCDDLTLGGIRQKQGAFLVAEGKVQTLEDAQRWIERRWCEHFTEFLNTWSTDADLWPKRRTRAMFRAWFNVQFHSMIW